MATKLAVDLVLVGAECPEDRALAGSLGAAAGAEAFGRAVSGAVLDGGADRCRIIGAPPDGDANALHTAVREGAERAGRLLVVYLAGQMVEDSRRRRPVLAVAGSRREDAHLRGLPFAWVLSAMEHGEHPESLLVVDVAVGRADWARLGAGDGLSVAAGSVPAWGRVTRYSGHGGVSRLRRVGGPDGPSVHAGGFARELAVLLNAGLPGASAVLDPLALDAALAGRGEEGEGVRVLPAPVGSRLLLRNRAALRGRLSAEALPRELREELGEQLDLTEREEKGADGGGTVEGRLA